MMMSMLRTYGSATACRICFGCVCLLVGLMGARVSANELKEVVDDHDFEYIYDHIQYGQLAEAYRMQRPDDFSNMWIKAFIRDDRDELPHRLDQVVDKRLPAYLKRMDKAIAARDEEKYRELRRDFQTQVERPVDRVYSAVLAELKYYRGAYRYHLDRLNARTGQRFPLAGGSVTTAQMRRSLSEKGKLDPIYVTLNARYNQFRTEETIVEDPVASAHAIRALAYLKLALLYEHQVFPFVSKIQNRVLLEVQRRDQAMQAVTASDGPSGH